MKLPVSILGALLLAATTSLYAQAPAAPAPGAKGEHRKHERFDCSKAKDPKACEERRSKMKAAHDKAKQACDGKQGADRRDCMQKQMCAQAKDPAKCEARTKERMEKRKEHQEKRQPGEKK
jgi:Spy/CpxP family protein refolding chaperone